MARVLVTGANGHIGANLCRQLLARGDEVVAFVRESSDLTGLDGLGVELKYGDVLDEASFITAADGCQAMYHLAAVYKMASDDPDEIMLPALEGTKHAFAAARAAGMRRIVMTSSVVAVGYSYDPSELRDEDVFNDDATTPYFRAKTESEHVARRLADEAGIELVTVLPSPLIGPLDYRLTPSTEIIAGFANGTNPSWSGGLNVARVHILAMDKGTAGQRYFAIGANLEVREVAQAVEQATGLKVPHLGGPRWFNLTVAFLMELVAKLTGGTPMMTREVVRDVVGRYPFFDDSRTRRALGFEPTSTEDSVADTLKWLVHMKAIKGDRGRAIAERFPAAPTWLPAKAAPKALLPREN